LNSVETFVKYVIKWSLQKFFVSRGDSHRPKRQNILNLRSQPGLWVNPFIYRSLRWWK